MAPKAWADLVRKLFPRADLFRAPSGWWSAHARLRPNEPITLIATLSPHGESWVAR